MTSPNPPAKTCRATPGLWRRLATCRVCGAPVAIFDEICAECGAGSPVQVQVSPSLIFTTFLSAAFLVFLKLT
jgi:hypothetical protein